MWCGESMDETCWFEAVQLNDSDLVVCVWIQGSDSTYPGKQTIQALQRGAPWVM